MPDSTATTETLDEASRRRPDFTEGEWLTLGDGKRWCLPEVRAERVEHVGPGGIVPGVEWRVGTPSCEEAEAAFSSFLEDSIQNADPETHKRRAGGIAVELGGILLRRNYRLSDQEIKVLLCFGFWERTLEDIEAFDDARECYASIERIGLGRPMETVGRLLASIPSSRQWDGSSRMN